ncbi:class I SAM-dependent methyltransferase [Pasteurellaceae bacterium HPA106]|uniref:class I SAM-dependent methyltransferase n=1 Tax=Spirabiliibacterium pneumoniae TaxID=221400 RepID=UPI001AAD6320|nr:class I SAM-dependent methyltransferase [Spirabiliibacterium pneumoniae]MBE2895610.1 class I SAM-dependent methyltransferase [Spirabiliibacterium pneumoniae]
MAGDKRWDRYACVYDSVIALAKRQRQQVFAVLDLHSHRTFWLPGCGSGQDLCYLPAQSAVYARDFSAKMLAKCATRHQRLCQQGHNLELHLSQGSALASGLDDHSVDCVLLHLILAVVDDETALLQEALRVLKNGGVLSIWDKAVPIGGKVTLMRRWINTLTEALGTRVTLQIDSLLDGLPLAIISQQTFFGGHMQHWCLRKIEHKDKG